MKDFEGFFFDDGGDGGGGTGQSASLGAAPAFRATLRASRSSRAS